MSDRMPLNDLKRKLENVIVIDDDDDDDDDVQTRPSKRARLNKVVVVEKKEKKEKKTTATKVNNDDNDDNVFFLNADFTVYTEDYDNDAYEERERESIESYWVCFIEKVRRAATDLKEKGYAVIPRLFNEEESTLYYRRMFALVVHYLGIENILETQPENKKRLEDFYAIFSKRKATELPPNKHGIWESHRSNHFDVVKAIRAHPKVALVFCLLYGLTSPTELVSSLDRINFKFPGRAYGAYQRPVKVDAFGNMIKQTKKTTTTTTTDSSHSLSDSEEQQQQQQQQKMRMPKEALEGWAHVDQHMDRTTKGGVVQSIQAFITLMDVTSTSDPGIRFYEGSHMVWEEWTDPKNKNKHFNQQEIKELTSRKNWSKWTPIQKCKLLNSTYGVGDDQVEKKKVRRVHPTYPKGSMVLWDSKTTHDPYDGDKDHKKGRFVVYVCMLPRFDELTTASFIKSKKEVYTKGYATAHTPIPQERFAKTPRTYGKVDESATAYFVIPIDKLSPEQQQQQHHDDDAIAPPKKDSLESYLFCFQEPTSDSRNKNKSDLRKGLTIYPSPFLTESERYLNTLKKNPSMLAFPNNNNNKDVDMDVEENQKTTDTVITFKGVALLESELASGKDRKTFETRNRKKKTNSTVTTSTK